MLNFAGIFEHFQRVNFDGVVLLEIKTDEAQRDFAKSVTLLVAAQAVHTTLT